MSGPDLKDESKRRSVIWGAYRYTLLTILLSSFFIIYALLLEGYGPIQLLNMVFVLILLAAIRAAGRRPRVLWLSLLLGAPTMG